MNRILTENIVEVVEPNILSCPLGCIVFLPGRNHDAMGMLRMYQPLSKLDQTLMVGITPKKFQWYPQPHGPDNQEEAVAGLESARLSIMEEVAKIVEKYHVPIDKTALVGFSAGGVMALYTAAYSPEPFAAAICHAGCLLDPKSLPEAKNWQTQIMMTHNKDDKVFSWDQRYVPTKEALMESRYNVCFREEDVGGHTFSNDDVRKAGLFLAPLLGYSPFWRAK